jgi:hypothetical protein
VVTLASCLTTGQSFKYFQWLLGNRPFMNFACHHHSPFFLKNDYLLDFALFYAILLAFSLGAMSNA